MENDEPDHITDLKRDLEFALQRLSNISDELYYVSHTTRYSFFSEEFDLAADSVKSAFIDYGFINEQIKLDLLTTLRRGVNVSEGYGLRFIPRDLEKIIGRVEAVRVAETEDA